MTTRMNDVYEKVAAQNGLDAKFVKSIGDCILGHTKEKLINTQEGSVYVAHVGAFVLKSVKVESQLKRYLSMRAYKISKYPDFINVPISKKAKQLFDVYRNVIIPFKKYKRALSQRQLEFCKKIYETYEENINNADEHVQCSS